MLNSSEWCIYPISIVYFFQNINIRIVNNPEKTQKFCLTVEDKSSIIEKKGVFGLKKGNIPWFEDVSSHKSITLGVSANTFFKGGRLVSNFCEVLGMGTHDGLNDMLRMSGVDPFFITGGGSDFDKLQALTEVLPLWIGHPYVTAIHGLLADLLSCRLPLTGETLPHVWTYTAEQLATENLTVGDLLTRYGYDHVLCQDDLPTSVVSSGLSTMRVWDATQSISPHHPQFTLSPCDKSLPPQQTWADAEAKLRSALDIQTASGVREIWVDMRGCDTYQRPHPYTAGQACVKIMQGMDASPEEKDVILAQCMRVLGQCAKERGVHVVLHGVSPQVYQTMTTYLAGCGGDASMTCIACDPQVAVSLARQGASVMLGVDLCATREQVFRLLDAVASGMPLGCLAGLYLPVSGLLDVVLVKRIYAWVDAWVAQMK